MQFDRRHREEILAGRVTLTFRRWKRRQAVPGNRYRTSLGRIEVESVDVVDPAAITASDARRAGYRSVDSLLEGISGDPDLAVYRVAFHVVTDPDPRDVLAAAEPLGAGDRAVLDARLDRLDRDSTHGPWTRETLHLIADHPATRAADLATMVGRETQPFKTDVRKLKNLGLTRSLEVGYRLSPRGRAYLDGRR
jgi:hypothetical protein